MQLHINWMLRVSTLIFSCFINCLYAQVLCQDGDIRLSGGQNSTEGRVEICFNNRWGTVCDDSWDGADATVVCSQLGLPSEGAIATTVGQGIGPIYLDEVTCVGNESRLADCQHRGIASHDCSHFEDAGVVCLGPCQNGAIRLRGGRSPTEGRVEICFNNQWGTVCDDSWSNSDGDVVCRQLGFSPNGAIVHFFATFGPGSGPIWLDNVHCSGTEGRLVSCLHNGVGNHNCDHSEDAGVSCQTCANGDIRLSGGVNDTEGRVEICYDATWGTVCDNMWGPTNADVVCKQLGFSSTGATAFFFAFFGQGTGSIWLDNAVCTGNETRLYDCQNTGIGVHNCSHFEDVGVRCQSLCEDGDVRLSGARSSTEGRVEICFNNQWGTVCDDFWDGRDATVVCTQLGLPSEGATATRVGQGVGLIFLDNVFCTGNETRLADCWHQGIASHDCSHYEDAGVVCSGPCSDGDIRLRDGRNSTEGRVEICFNNQWGTVCDDFWSNDDGNVVCRQLGFSPTGAVVHSSAFFGPAIGPIWLDNVHCSGTESRLVSCLSNGIGNHNCYHSEDAGVTCQSCANGDIRLSGGVNDTEGRVEICYNATWGTVCDNMWGSTNADVVCRQLGFSSTGATVFSFAFFGQGTGSIWLDNVVCIGNEIRLYDCQNTGIGVHNCSHFEDVGVRCLTEFLCQDGQIRLQGGRSSTEGRVEICFNNQWGTVCDDFWDARDATVVCTQLGLPSEGAAATTVGQGIGPIFLDNVFCTGNESRLADCQHWGIASHDCSHSEDAGVVCSGPCSDGDVRLRDGQTPSEGRVEICFNNQWGTVCDDSWSIDDGNVVCRQLGFSPTGAVIHSSAFFGHGIGPIWLDDVHCSGTESRLVNCLSNGLGNHNCYHSEDAGVTCQNLVQQSTVAIVPTNTPTFSPSGLAKLTSPFFSPTTETSPPSQISNGQSTVTASVVPAVVLLVLGLLALTIVLLVVKRRRKRRRMKASHNISWTKRNDHAIEEGVACTPEGDGAGTDTDGMTFQNSYAVPTDKGATGNQLKTVNSGHLRQLTGKMLIPNSRIRLLDTIGHGEFGIVYKAHLLPKLQLDKSSPCPLPETVAVKTLKGYFGHEEIKSIMSESVKMKRFDHPNVISLIGVCIDAGPAPYIIMPFMGNGSLLSYLKKHRTELMPSDTADEDIVADVEKRLISMCLEVAKGMEYLAEQKFVHRDLAARNCMIDLHHVIKVSDFGLTEDIYVKNYFQQGKESSAVKLPVKWMSLESLHDGIFSEKTDVWSFGITCWEVFSGGKNPYPGVDPLSLVQLLENERRLDKPLNAACSDTMYQIMLKCWLISADDRPSFSQLVALVSTALERQAGYLDISCTCTPTAGVLSTSPECDSREKFLGSPSPISPIQSPITVAQPDNEIDAPNDMN